MALTLGPILGRIGGGAVYDVHGGTPATITIPDGRFFLAARCMPTSTGQLKIGSATFQSTPAWFWTHGYTEITGPTTITVTCTAPFESLETYLAPVAY